MKQELHAWYAVYTKAKMERKVADLLARKQLESYCPMNVIGKPSADRRKSSEEPLFSSYVFVRIPEGMLDAVRETEGIVNFVYWLGKPAVIHDGDIEMIRRFMREHRTASLEKIPMRIADTDPVKGSTLLYYRGRTPESNRNKVRAVLSSLGYALVAAAPVHDLNVRKADYIYA
ncbi:UpxY family transcription antiterminator [Chitinophaga pollutisoli]|uniref:UpxY family transcription antiterminator n=1 Tax=Chitinophaga pollutisoli TaxID=3133966 RepID=A0ABZ2YHT3_9BACT